MNDMPSNEIWVFAEYRDAELTPATLALLAEAQKLAGELNGKTCACLFGYNIQEGRCSLENSGAEKVYFIDDVTFSESSLDAYAHALQGLITAYNPRIIFFNAASSGSELSARISWRMGLPFVTEVKRIDVEKEHLVIAKSCYDDKVYQNYLHRPERTLILSFLPEDVDSEKRNAAASLEMVEEKVRHELPDIRTRHRGYLKGDPKTISLEEADIIVAGGKGIGKDASQLEELADLLGASVGGTRPLVDEGAIAFERQIGITGKSVSPRLLFVFGISGAREFTAGTEKARITIAINTDEKAAIFKNADLKIHGDLKEIIPALVQKLRQTKEKNQ